MSCLSAREQEERLKRILNQGIFENDSIDILKFEKILPNFEKFKLNHERQRSLGNFDSTVVFLDYTTEFGLNDVELRRFIRYLVMNDKIYCFSERFNFGILAHLFIYDPGRVHLASEEQPLQTKNTLLQNDERLMDLQYPKISDFLPEEQAEMETILRLLKIIHYKRRIFNAPKYSITHHIDHDVTHSMDQLVRLGVIYAWSFYSDLRQLSIKLTDEDVLPEFSSHFSLWRDRELIEKEEAFKRANQIILRETDENEIRKN
ncbi:MAG: hypothetical protein HWD61_00720 [Parachlamydiaceae bacterium]|nr:MAG: hypothetical protein HWD61_00720 [Parachlamydiaceae bacterium]